MNLPMINFVELQDKTEEGLIAYLRENRCEFAFLVYLRTKYVEDAEWEYLIEACDLYIFDNLIWLNDWYEGQPFVEYLAVTQIIEQ